MQIWEFPLDASKSSPCVDMPRGSRILSVGMQGGTVMIWALVNPDSPISHRKFHVAGTGWDIEYFNAGPFIGTVFDGSFVWHIFEVFRSDVELD